MKTAALFLVFLGIALSFTTEVANLEAPDPTSFDRVVLEAYNYAFPLVLMEFTRRAQTNVEVPQTGSPAAPMNQLFHSSSYPGPNDRTVVRPNADTFYSISWMNLIEEPMVLILPESDRYSVIQFMDMWTDVFASPGSRTTGNGKQILVISTAIWEGEEPEGTTLLRCPTAFTWLIARYQVNGVDDFEHVSAIQNQMVLVPLSVYLSGNADTYIPPLGEVNPEFDYPATPPQVTFSLTLPEFFGLFNALLNFHPPHLVDNNMVGQLKQIGVERGQPFNPVPLSSIQEGVVQQTLLSTVQSYTTFFVIERGWRTSSLLGSYGTSYLQRTVISLGGLGANLFEDAIYYSVSHGSDSNLLSCDNQYTLTFPANEMPPVNAFWSISLYNQEGYFQENSINRYAIGDRDFDTSNDITLRIQSDTFEDTETEFWLPCIAGEPFNLLLRLYYPSPDALFNDLYFPQAVSVQSKTTNLDQSGTTIVSQTGAFQVQANVVTAASQGGAFPSGTTVTLSTSSVPSFESAAVIVSTVFTVESSQTAVGSFSVCASAPTATGICLALNIDNTWVCVSDIQSNGNPFTYCGIAPGPGEMALVAKASVPVPTAEFTNIPNPNPIPVPVPVDVPNPVPYGIQVPVFIPVPVEAPVSSDDDDDANPIPFVVQQIEDDEENNNADDDNSSSASALQFAFVLFVSLLVIC